MITDQQIDFILEDLTKRGILTESLRLSLLDHICVLIEKNLDKNGDFEQFYANTIRTFYKNDLSELEKETTQYLLYQNNILMKKAMLISGVLAATGFIGGSIGKIMLSRFTDFLLLSGFAIFVLLFLPLVFFVLLKDLKAKKDLIIYGSGISSLMLYFICMLIKCLGVPASNLHLGLDNGGNTWLVMWLAGLAIASFIFIPAFLIAGMRKPETRFNAILTSVLLIAFIGVQFRLTNLKQFRSAESPRADIHISSKSTVTVKFW